MDFEVSDDFWRKVNPLLPAPNRERGSVRQRAPGGGRKPVDARSALSTILHVLRTGISWRESPQLSGSAQTIHRYFKIWQKSGVFTQLRAAEWSNCPELKGIDWDRAEGKKTAAAPAANAQPVSLAVAPTLREREPSITDSRIQAHLLRLHSATDARSFWNALRALFSDCIPHNAMIAYLDYLDHPQSWKAATMLATPNAIMPSDWFEERWKLDITRPFVRQNPGIKCFRFSDIIADQHAFQRTTYFQQFFKPFGWYHTVCLDFWNQSNLHSVIALRRTRDQGDYRPSEMALFAKLHVQIETALRRLVATHDEFAIARSLRGFAQHLPLPLLLLDWDLKPYYVNNEASQQCAVWNYGPDRSRAYNPRQVFRVPPAILAACTEMKERWMKRDASGGETPASSRRLSHHDLPGHTATVTLEFDGKHLLSRPGFLIYFDCRESSVKLPTNSSDKTALWRLTSAERDIVQLASAGYSNSEISAQLHKSVNTVKHRLTAIYRKLEINGRGRRLVNSLGGKALESA